MSTTGELVGLASALLQSSQPEKALELLAPHAEQKQDDVAYLQAFGETLLENNQVEPAYQVLVRACELDAEAVQGSEKFLYLGQIIGGRDGVDYIDTGLRRLEQQMQVVVANDPEAQRDSNLVALAQVYPTKDAVVQYFIKKLNQGIFAQIEIWMTDLCMEPEAEGQCDALITKSLELDSLNAELWSLLASIRISQQRNADAAEALRKSWDLFEAKKTKLEEAQNADSEDTDAFDVGVEYAEMLQPLLTLSKLAIELELYEIAAQAASASQDINESMLDAYYYEGLAHILEARRLYCTDRLVKTDYRETPLPKPEAKGAQLSSPIQAFVDDARTALTNGYKIMNSSDEVRAELDEDVVEQVNALLEELGGPLMSELLPKREVEEEGWEEEITSDVE